MYSCILFSPFFTVLIWSRAYYTYMYIVYGYRQKKIVKYKIWISLQRLKFRGWKYFIPDWSPWNVDSLSNILFFHSTTWCKTFDKFSKIDIFLLEWKISSIFLPFSGSSIINVKCFSFFSFNFQNLVFGVLRHKD